MFGIGTVARLAQVSVRTLRYYDEIGLLAPVWVDPDTGYRWYAPEQLHRLHRILALRDLGVQLQEIAVLLADDLSVDELRGILLLRRAEAHERVLEETELLAHVEARLRQMEEETMTDYDVIVKRVEPEWVIAVHEELADVSEVVPAHERQLAAPARRARRARHRVPRTRRSRARQGEGPIHFTAALPVHEDVTIDDDGIASMRLPGLDRVAATVLHGDPDFHDGFAALIAWAEEAGEERTGELREVYLDCDGPRDTWVVELQIGLQPKA